MGRIFRTVYLELDQKAISNENSRKNKITMSELEHPKFPAQYIVLPLPISYFKRYEMEIDILTLL